MYTAEQLDRAGFSDLAGMKVKKPYRWSPNGYDVLSFAPDGKDSPGQLAPRACVERAVEDGAAVAVDLPTDADTGEKPKGGKKGGKK